MGTKMSDDDSPAKRTKLGDHHSSRVKEDGDDNGMSEEHFWDLGKKKRATLKSWQNELWVDVRQFYGDDKDMKPGAKGLLSIIRLKC